MQFPIVREYQTDVKNTNPDNEVRNEPFSVDEGVWTRVIVPKHSPFFVESLKLYFPNGQPMNPGEHYRIFKLMPLLTDTVGHPVSCTIELLDETITEGLIDYDVVGEFSLFDTSLMSMIMAVEKDDRPVWWENLHGKPVVFPPILHKHSLLYDIVAFQDLIDLMDSVAAALDKQGLPLIQIRIKHYMDLLTHYLNMYKGMLLKYLQTHMATHNHHGLKAVQVALEKVDNFPTATSTADLRSNRRDMHLTVRGLKTIVDQTGFDAKEFIADGTLPITQFGNTNFIPPSIDGSFEGLGGQLETAGISMESDGSIVFLQNRFDGRVDGLYYSVMQTPFDPVLNNLLNMSYTSYRYQHQRIEADNARVNRIAQGSGDECIFMCDTRKKFWYIGSTHGSLDPAKHVLSRVNMTPLLADLPAGADIVYYMRYMNVFLMGNWIFISLAHGNWTVPDNSDAGNTGDIRYRSFWRVPLASVEAQLPVTPTRLNLSFIDGDGVQVNNATKWRICTPVNDPNYPQGYPYFLKYYWNFKQRNGIDGNMQTTGLYRSQQTFVAPHPTKAGIYVIKLLGAFWCRFVAPGINNAFQNPLEMTYEINPETGVMTLLHQTPKGTGTIDLSTQPPQDPANLNHMLFAYDAQGAAVLDDGTIVSSYSVYQSFPRGVFLYRPRDFKTKYNVVSRLWNNQLGAVEAIGIKYENILSPIKSGVRTRGFLLGNASDFYNAATGIGDNSQLLYWRGSAGKLIQRSDITNLLFNDVRARPLKNDVRLVRGDPRVGGAFVTVPSAQLDANGMDLAENTFCVNSQKFMLPLTNQAPEWPIASENDGVMLISDHTTRINAAGELEVVPTASIYYPASIIAQLKQQVDEPAFIGSAPKVVVTICDPTGKLTNKFGWLPVLVHISWGKPGTVDRHQTFLSITPTYSGGANRTVTGFTVLDKMHAVWPDYASGLTPTSWDAFLQGAENTTSHGPMRCGYHVNGNEIRGYFDSGVTCNAVGDAVQVQAEFLYTDKNTRRWSNQAQVNGTYLIIQGNSYSGGHRSCVPDHGVVVAIPHALSGGGAATIFAKSDGTNSYGGADQAGLWKAILGHVYPEVGWIVFFKEPIKVVFNGKMYTLPAGTIDLRDIDTAPSNKTFYIYALLKDGKPTYEIAQEKRLETSFQAWVGTVVTNNLQILTIERFNVSILNGNRISELKRGNAIPAASGLANTEGQIPWLTNAELLP